MTTWPNCPTLRQQWQALAFDHAKYLGDVGLSVPAGEVDRTPLEMIWSRPTAEVNGIWGGYTGAGFKTVLPAEAHAKVSFRLVSAGPGQDPHRLPRWAEAQMPADCEIDLARRHRRLPRQRDGNRRSGLRIRPSGADR
jgi:acetylornithine deacetylase/succinyl-diaminopimelate desuccinylase-like protein